LVFKTLKKFPKVLKIKGLKSMTIIINVIIIIPALAMPKAFREILEHSA